MTDGLRETRWLPARAAAVKAGLSRDHVTRLCRLGKVDGRLKRQQWLVNEESLQAFLLSEDARKAAQAEQQRVERRAEYRQSTRASGTRGHLPRVRAEEILSRLAKATLVLIAIVALVILAAGAGTVLLSRSRDTRGLAATLAQVPSIGSRVANDLAAAGAAGSGATIPAGSVSLATVLPTAVPRPDYAEGTLSINVPIQATQSITDAGSLTVTGLTTVKDLSALTLDVAGPATVRGLVSAAGGIVTSGANVDLQGGRIFAANLVNDITAGTNVIIAGTPNHPIISVRTPIISDGGSLGGGGIQSLIAGAGLTGGRITNSGSIDIDFGSVNDWSGAQTFSGGVSITSTATTTALNGIDLSGGCFAIESTCITPAGLGGISGLGSGFATTTATAIAFATTTASFDGLTVGTQIIPATGTLTFTPTLTGVLAAAGGGTGMSSPTAAGVLLGNYAGTGWQQLATSTLGLLTTDVAEGNNLYWTNTRFDTRLAATTTLPNLTTLANLTAVGTITSGSWQGTAIGTGKGGTGTTTWQTGSILFYGGTRFTENNSNLFWDNTNNRLGLGTSSPGSLLSIGGTGTGWNFFDNGTTTSSAKGINLANGGCFATGGACLSAAGLGGLSGPGAANRVAYYTGASTLTSSPNFTWSGTYAGLGTTTPEWLLELASSTAPQLTLSDGAAGNHWSLRSAGGSLYLATSSPATFATSSVAALTIDTNGNATYAGGLTVLGATSLQAATSTDFAITDVANSLLAANGQGSITASSTIGWNLIKGQASSIFAFDASGTPTATTSIGVNYLASIGANTILGNPFGASGAVTAFATSTLGIALADTTGTLAASRGGTGQSSYTTGDLLYASGAATLSKLGIGTGGYVLASVDGIPSWVATSSINNGVSSIAQTYGSAQTGALTLATSSATSFNGLFFTNTIMNAGTTFTFAPPTVSGTLAVAGGGTGAAIFSQGWLYSPGGTSALAASTSPTINYITATSTTATSTFGYGVNLNSGCYAIGGTCLSAAGLGGLSSVTADFPLIGIGTAGSHLTFTGLSTSSPATIGNLTYFSGPNTFANIATTTVSCTGTTSCNPFSIIGSSPVTITGAGSATGLGTSTPWTTGQVAYVTSPGAVTSVATSSFTVSGPFSVAGAFGAFVGGTNSTLSWTGFATTSNLAAGQLLYSNGGPGVTGVGTTSVTCSGLISCASFYAIGSGSPVIATAATSTNYWYANGTNIYNGNGGNVGIGTTSPGTIFSIGNTGSNFINLSNTSTSTFAYGMNLAAGCYATNGNCLSAVGLGGVSSVSATFPLVSSGGTTPTLSFVGLSTSTQAVVGAVPYFSGVNTFASTATSSIASGSGITVTGGGTAYVIGAQPTITCNTANGSTLGCLAGADWTSFNNKVSSTSLSASFPLAYNSGTGAFSYNGLATSSALSTGQLTYATGVNTLAAVATSTLGFSGPFSGSGWGALVSGANSTLTWTGLATTTNLAAGQLLYSNGGAGVTFVATSSITCTGSASCGAGSYVIGSPLTITDSGITALGSGFASTTATTVTFATTTNSISNDWGITSSAGTLTFNLPTATAAVRGLLSPTDWSAFNSKISSSSLSATFPLAYNSATGAFSFNGLSTSTAAITSNLAYFSGANTLANVATSTLTFSGPFSGTGYGAFVGGANSTLTWTGLATTSAIATSQLLYSTSVSGVASVATSSLAAGTGVTFAGTPGYLVGGTLLTINTPWTISGSNIYNNNAGNVGIGTSTPYADLTIWDVNTLSSPTVKQTYSSAGTNTYIVPPGITQITVKVWGGGGGGSSGSAKGGGGGYATGVISVTPGQSFTISVGSGGTAGTNNGQLGSAGGPGGGTSGTAGSGTFVGGGGTASAGGTGGTGGTGTNGTTGIAHAGGNGGAAGTGGAGGTGGGGSGSTGTGTSAAGGGGGESAVKLNSTYLVEAGAGGGAGGGGTGSATAGGGGGGSGCFGGGGAETSNLNGTGGGGGGGSSCLDSSVTATSTTAGSGANAGNNGDSSYTGSAGAGGGAASAGNPGLIVIIGSAGSSGSFIDLVDHASTTMASFYKNGTAYLAGGLYIGTTTNAVSTSTPLVVGNTAYSTGVVAAFQNGNGTCFIDPTTTSLSCSSDLRLKKNLTALDASSTLAALMQLNPVTYNWNSEASGTPTHTGFIAQQVLTVLPDLISEGPDGYYTLNYAGFTPYLVKAIQEIAAVEGAFRDNLIAWLGDASNGINDFFAKTIYGNDIYVQNSHFANELCLGPPGNETCITKAQLDALLAGQHISAQPSEPAQQPTGQGSAPAETTDASSTPTDPAITPGTASTTSVTDTTGTSTPDTSDAATTTTSSSS